MSSVSPAAAASSQKATNRAHSTTKVFELKSVIHEIANASIQTAAPPSRSIIQKTPVDDSSKCADFLKAFVSGGLVSADFKLSLEHIQTIEELYKNWALGNNVSLLDLLGFSIYDTLNQLPHNDFREIKVEFLGNMFRLYRNCRRCVFDNIPLSTRSKNTYDKDCKNIALSLSFIFLRVKSVIDEKNNRLKAGRLKQHAKEDLIKANRNLLKSLDNATKLLQFLITKPEPKERLQLLLGALRHFPGSTALCKSAEETLNHITRFFLYVQNMFSFSYQMSFYGTSAIELHSISLGASKEGLVKFLCTTKDYKRRFSAHFWTRHEELDRAVKGELSYEEWKSQYHIKSDTDKETSEFYEALHCDMEAAQLAIAFLTDTERLVDSVILPKKVAGWISNDQETHQFWTLVNTIYTKTTTPISEELHPAVIVFKKQIRDHFTAVIPLMETMQSRLKAAEGSGKLPESPNDEQVKELLNVLNERAQAIQELIPILNNGLKETILEVEHVTSFEKQLKKEFFLSNLPYIEMFHLVRCFYRTQYEFDKKVTIPNDFEQFLLLRWLKLPSSSPVVSLQEPETVTLLEKLIDSAIEQGAEELPSKQTFIKTTKREKVLSEPDHERNDLEEKERVRFTCHKLNDVITHLRELGLKEDHCKGGHMIFRRTANVDGIEQFQGPPVVVPHHKTIPLGTLKCITRQVEAALFTEPLL